MTIRVEWLATDASCAAGADPPTRFRRNLPASAIGSLGRCFAVLSIAPIETFRFESHRSPLMRGPRIVASARRSIVLTGSNS
jgi:hypothetical protein